MGEKSLHAGIKAWYAQPGDVLETWVDGFLIDIVRGPLLVEIQTRNLGALAGKLARLTTQYAVRLVYPIAQEKWIVRLAEDGHTVLGRRRSPKRGRLEQLFLELDRLPPVWAGHNFSLEVLLTKEEDIRCHDGRGSWRRKGWSLYDRRLLGVCERVVFTSPADLYALLPPALPHPFTSADLAQALGQPCRLAQAMIRCLRKLDLLGRVGRQSHRILYTGRPSNVPELPSAP